MKTDRLGMTRRDIQAVNAAKLYYAGRSQSEVAEILRVSRPNISKLLSHAKERGFVQVIVEDPREKDRELIHYLKDSFGLVEVRLVAPVSSRITELHKALGQAGADLLRGLIRDGEIVGIAWSRTMGQVAAAMGETNFKDVKIVSLCGCTGDSSTDFAIAQGFESLRESLNAQAYLLDYPCFFDSVAAKQVAIGIETVRRTLEMALEAHIVVYTVGAKNSIARVMADVVPDEKQKHRLTEMTVGDICSHFVDGNARVCLPDLNARTLSISLPDLRHKEQKVLVAGGTEKLDAIYAALANGYANRFVTDVATAWKLYANHRRAHR